MSHWHIPRRRDANHAAIVDALRNLGCSVTDLGSVGKGVPDLLVGYDGKTVLIEVKNPARKTRGDNAAKTLERQQRFREIWRGSPVHVVETIEAAIAALS
jgi:Holliday junction resolvase